MSQEWQRGREGERLRETDGKSGVGDLQRRAEEEGSVTTHGMGREGEPSSTSGTAARAAAISSLSGSIALGGDEFSLLH